MRYRIIRSAGAYCVKGGVCVATTAAQATAARQNAKRVQRHKYAIIPVFV